MKDHPNMSCIDKTIVRNKKYREKLKTQKGKKATPSPR